MTTTVVDTPVQQLEIWEGSKAQIEQAIQSGVISDNSIAVAVDADSFVTEDEIGRGKLTLQVNQSTVATFNANSKENAIFNVDLPEEQIQSDWNQTNTSSKDYIKNKPTVTSITVKRF